MAIQPNALFPTKTNPPGPGYSYGSARNSASPGDGIGTPFDQAVLNDIWGFFQALLKNAGPLVPSGVPDTEDASDYLDSIIKIIAANAPKKGVLTGLLIENEAGNPNTDIQVNTGTVRSQSTEEFIILTAPIIKRINATWAIGSLAGGMFSGTVASDETYHVFLIKQNGTGIVDAGFDIDVAGANVPPGWSAFARIASIRTGGSANIINFIQDGDTFWYKTPLGERDVSLTTTTSQTILLNTNTPKKIGGEAIIQVNDSIDTGASTACAVVISGTALDDIIPVQNGVLNTYNLNNFNVAGYRRSYYAQLRLNVPIQNDDAQIRFRFVRTGAAAQNQRVSIIGWTDKRGKV